MAFARFASLATICISIISTSTSVFAQYAAVTHSPVQNQQDVGFCWSYALSGLMEAESLKQNKIVTVSPEFLGFYHLLEQTEQMLPQFLNLAVTENLTAGTPISGNVKSLIASYVGSVLQPQEGNYAGAALVELAKYGAVPETFFRFKFAYGKDASGHNIEVTPTLQERLTNFSMTKLLNSQQVAIYTADSEALRQDLMVVLGTKVPKPTDSFSFEGSTYTAETFLAQYLQFVPQNYTEVAVDLGHRGEAFATIQKALSNDESVMVGFAVMDDVDKPSFKKLGEFDPNNCRIPFVDRCNSVGGHEVLIVAMHSLANGVGNFLVKNSWGDEGLNALGQHDQDAANLGFFILDGEYLTQKSMQDGSGIWSYVIHKKYLQ